MKAKTSWKTSLLGILSLAGAVGIQFYPEYAKHFNAMNAFCAGLGLLFARDNNRSDEQAGAGKIDPGEDKRQGKFLIGILLVWLVVVLCSGCAVNSQYASGTITTTTTDTNGVVTVKEEKHLAKAKTLATGDTKATIDKARASSGKTASVGAAGINEESSTGNLATNLNAAKGLIDSLKSP